MKVDLMIGIATLYHAVSWIVAGAVSQKQVRAQVGRSFLHRAHSGLEEATPAVRLLPPHGDVSAALQPRQSPCFRQGIQPGHTSY